MQHLAIVAAGGAIEFSELGELKLFPGHDDLGLMA